MRLCCKKAVTKQFIYSIKKKTEHSSERWQLRSHKDAMLATSFIYHIYILQFFYSFIISFFLLSQTDETSNVWRSVNGINFIYFTNY